MNHCKRGYASYGPCTSQCKWIIEAVNIPSISIFKAQMTQLVPLNDLLLDNAPIIGLLISRWELEKFKNFWNKSFRTSKTLTLLYLQFSNLLISQRDMSGPRLGAMSNNRWSGGTLRNSAWASLHTRSIIAAENVCTLHSLHTCRANNE